MDPATGTGKRLAGLSGALAVAAAVSAAACALEFEGFLAATLRLAMRGVLAAAAPTLEHATFSSRIDALRWVSGRSPELAPTSDALRGLVDAATSICDRRAPSW